MKSVFSKKSKPDPELFHLKEELLTAQGDLSQAYRRFDQAVDPELVEACIYEINAVTARCNYLLRIIKERSPQPSAARCPQKPDSPHKIRPVGEAETSCALPCTNQIPDAAPVPCGDEKGDIVWT